MKETLKDCTMVVVCLPIMTVIFGVMLLASCAFQVDWGLEEEDGVPLPTDYL